MNPAVSIFLHRDFAHLKREIHSALRQDFGRVSVEMGQTDGEDSVVTVAAFGPDATAATAWREKHLHEDPHATATRIVSAVINQQPLRPH